MLPHVLLQLLRQLSKECLPHLPCTRRVPESVSMTHWSQYLFSINFTLFVCPNKFEFFDNYIDHVAACACVSALNFLIALISLRHSAWDSTNCSQISAELFARHFIFTWLILLQQNGSGYWFCSIKLFISFFDFNSIFNININFW